MNDLINCIIAVFMSHFVFYIESDKMLNNECNNFKYNICFLTEEYIDSS